MQDSNAQRQRLQSERPKQQMPNRTAGAATSGRHRITRLIDRLKVLRRDLAGIPLIHAAHVPHDESQPHAHALTSTIIFQDTRVLKIYAPGLVPRLIYWLAFQAEFPYLRNQHALQAAVLRRNLAGMLTEYWYGENRVAPALGIEEFEGRFAIVSEFINGRKPADPKDGRRFLFDLADRFDDAGLPTWQVDPRQPRAMDNVLETADGKYWIIDLESGLVSPLASPRAWWRAFQRARIPIYDDVYFDLTRKYVREESDAMRRKLGDPWLERLQNLIDDAEFASNRWHASEPRIWSRLARRVVRPESEGVS